MILRYVRAKDPDKLSMYFNRLRRVRLSVISGPVFNDGYWYVWISAEAGVIRGNITIEE